MKDYSNLVIEVIQEADIVIEVLDARYPKETRNIKLEDYIERKRKKLIYVLNKSDLLDEIIDNIKLNFEPYVFVSAKKNLGTTRLRKLITSLIEKKPINIGIIGYPNTGKSSLINALKQKRSARTSPIPGFTKGMQKLKIMDGVYLIDTPGVIPENERNKMKHAMLNVENVETMKDPDVIAGKIIKEILFNDKKILENFYKIKIDAENVYEVIEKIAVKFNWLLKKGIPNIDLASRRIIKDWQEGKFT